MRPWSALIAFALPAAASAGEFNVDQYPESTVVEVLRKHPCKSGKGSFETKDILFSTKAEFRPSRRAASKERLELIGRWTAKLNVPEEGKRFGQEIALGTGSVSTWANVTLELLDAMKADLGPGETAWFYMSFAGCAGEEPVFVIEEFSPIEYEDLGEGVTSVIT